MWMPAGGMHGKRQQWQGGAGRRSPSDCFPCFGRIFVKILISHQVFITGKNGWNNKNFR